MTTLVLLSIFFLASLVAFASLKNSRLALPIYLIVIGICLHLAFSSLGHPKPQPFLPSQLLVYNMLVKDDHLYILASPPSSEDVMCYTKKASSKEMNALYEALLLSPGGILTTIEEGEEGSEGQGQLHPLPPQSPPPK